MDEGVRRDQNGKKYLQDTEVRMPSYTHLMIKELTCWQRFKKCLFGESYQQSSNSYSQHVISQENVDPKFNQIKTEYKKGSLETDKPMFVLETDKGKNIYSKKKDGQHRDSKDPKKKDKKQKINQTQESQISNPSQQELNIPAEEQTKIKKRKPKKEIVLPVYEYDQPPLIIVKPQIASQIETLSQSSTPIDNSEQFPYNRIGCLFINTNSNSKYKIGTGTVVGSKYVLTASHNLFNRQSNTQYKSFTFKLRYKNYNELHEFDKEYRVKSFKHHKDKNYQNLKNKKNSVEYDYAFLELDTQQDLEEFNCFKFNLKQPEKNNEEKVMISYPLQSNIIRFIECRGNVIFQEKQALYQLHLEQGSSGAALLTCDNNEFFITAIHSGKVIAGENNQNNQKQTKFRGGPIFTDNIFCELMQFMASIEGVVDLKNKLIGSKGCSLLRQCLNKQFVNLNLTNNSFGVEGCKELAKSKWLNLTTLNLSNNQLGDDECLKVLKDAVWPNLTQLILAHNRIDASGCKWIKEANYPNLKVLNIGYNNIGNEGCLEISQAEWPQLTHIYLYWNSIETEGCSHLSKANWPKLTFIDIHENFVDHEGCKSLTTAHWPELKEIILDKNVIGDEGCRYLKDANWPQLQSIHLWRNSIEEQGFQQILTSVWPKLKFINLSESSVDNPQKFQERFLQKHQHLDIIL